MIDNNVDHLINGKKTKTENMYHCSTARSSTMCGEEGKYYESKN